MDWKKIEKYKNEKVLRLDSLCIEKSMVCHNTCPCCNCQIDGWLEILLEQLLIKQVRYLMLAFSQITREMVSVLNRDTQIPNAITARRPDHVRDGIRKSDCTEQVITHHAYLFRCISIVHATHFSSIEIVLLQSCKRCHTF